MITIDQTYKVNAPLAKLWQALTDAAIIEQWGAGPATMDAREGGSFSLWGGDIHGTNTKVVANKILRQDWYGHDHPDRKYDVTFSFGGDDTTSTVRVSHTAWDDDSHSMGDGWRDYYFEPIKKLLEQQKA